MTVSTSEADELLTIYVNTQRLGPDPRHHGQRPGL